MSPTQIVASVVVVVLIIGIIMVIRMRAHRALTTVEIAQLVKRVEARTGVDPTKPLGFQLQSDGTWAQMQPVQTQKEP